MTNKNNYLSALRFNFLNAYYDIIINLTAREKHFKHLLLQQAHISNTPVSKIIDVGAGTGTLALWAKKQHPHTEVHALDGDPQMLSIAATKATSMNLDIRLQQGLSYAMPYDNEYFDLCFSSLFFHHLTREHKKETFQEIIRILKPQGEIHIADWGKASTIFMRCLFLQVQLFDGFTTTADNINGHIPYLLEDAGFRKVSILREIPTMFGTITLYKASKA